MLHVWHITSCIEIHRRYWSMSLCIEHGVYTCNRMLWRTVCWNDIRPSPRVDEDNDVVANSQQRYSWHPARCSVGKVGEVRGLESITSIRSNDSYPRHECYWLCHYALSTTHKCMDFCIQCNFVQVRYWTSTTFITWQVPFMGDMHTISYRILRQNAVTVGELMKKCSSQMMLIVITR